MDNIKDTKRSTELSKFIDDQSVRTNPFGQNISGDQAYRRAERIAEGVYLVTNHVSETEPARMRARELSAELLSCVLTLRSGFRTSGGNNVRTAHACIREMISMVRILAVSGNISFQNAATVGEALDDLGYFLSAAQRSTLAESMPLTKEDLTPKPRPLPHTPTSATDISRTFTSPIKDKKERDASKSTKGYKVDEIRMRTESVIDILKNGGALNIKDISAHFPEYSEKTVQRALAALVKKGDVRFTGMKRWRKYSLGTVIR